MDDVSLEAVVWVPAHCSKTDVGRATLGNRQLLTATDLRANAEADRLAKLGGSPPWPRTVAPTGTTAGTPRPSAVAPALDGPFPVVVKRLQA